MVGGCLQHDGSRVLRIGGALNLAGDVLSTEAVPPWKFWHPIPIWQMFVILLIAQVTMQLAAVGLNEAVGLPWHDSIGAGVGGLVGYLAIRAWAGKLARKGG